MSDEACFVYITTGSKEEAITIGRDLVEEKLAAASFSSTRSLPIVIASSLEPVVI